MRLGISNEWLLEEMAFDSGLESLEAKTTGTSPFGSLFLFVFFFVLTVLPAPNASIESERPTAVIVRWEPPIRNLPDGILLGYYLFLRDLNTTTVTGPTATNASLPYSDCIQVAAFTIEGSGNFTECLSVQRRRLILFISRKKSITDNK